MTGPAKAALKTKYILTGKGKIIRRIPRDVVVRERRKLKKLARFVKAGEVTPEAFRQQYKSWRGDKRRYNAYHTLRNMDKLFKELNETWKKENSLPKKKEKS